MIAPLPPVLDAAADRLVLRRMFGARDIIFSRRYWSAKEKVEEERSKCRSS